MKRLVTIFAFSATVLFSGCASTPEPGEITSAVTPPAASQITPMIAGNWQFDATPATPGESPLTIAGGINQDGAAVSGALHVDGSKCFDRMTTVGFSGTVSAATTSLISTAVEGQFVTLAGKFSNTAFTGTYKIEGGCADGKMGNVIGNYIPYIGNTLSGSFTSSANKTFNVVGEIEQSASAGSAGSFELSGAGTFDTSCFKEGAIRPGTFPTGSFILGRTVSLEFETNNGTLAFLGTLSADRSEMTGTYSVTGGSCEDSGTAVLDVASPWDY